MSENESGSDAPEQTPPAPVDELKNLKAEMQRKFSNLEATNAALKQLLEAQKVPAPAAPVADDLDTVWFQNPQAAKERIKNELKSEVRRELDEQESIKTRYSSTVSPLYSQYPELQDQNSELFQKARVALGGMSEADMVRNPALVKAAVLEAAQELDLKPASKRKSSSSDNEGFTASATASGSKPAPKRTDIDSATEAFARIIGKKYIDIDNPETRKRIQNKHGRKSYTRFE